MPPLCGDLSLLRDPYRSYIPPLPLSSYSLSLYLSSRYMFPPRLGSPYELLLLLLLLSAPYPFPPLPYCCETRPFAPPAAPILFMFWSILNIASGSEDDAFEDAAPPAFCLSGLLSCLLSGLRVFSAGSRFEPLTAPLSASAPAAGEGVFFARLANA